MGTAYADLKDLIHRKEPETHDFFNYRTRKPEGELDKIKRSKMPVRKKIRARVGPVFAIIQRLKG